MRDYAQPRSPEADRPPRVAARPVHGLVRLQQAAGNRAVTGLVQRTVPAVQRVAAEPAQFPDTFNFSPLEELWIDQVWQNPGVQLMFQAYGELPTPVLERTEAELDASGRPDLSTEGVTHNFPDEGQADIEIFDASYDIAEQMEPAGKGMREGTPEEEFKSTLIHELFHFVENNTKDVDPKAVRTPEELRAVLVEPRMDGLPACTYGWFARGTEPIHLDAVEVGKRLVGDPSAWVDPESEEGKAKTEKRYEHSPDPRDLEEDLATSIGWFLTGPDTRAHLYDKYPKRYALLDDYFAKLFARYKERLGR